MTRIPTTPNDIRQLVATLQVVANEYESIAARMEAEGISDIPARGTSTFMHHVAKIEGNVNSIMKTLQDAIRDKRKSPVKRPAQVSSPKTPKIPEIPGTRITSADELAEAQRRAADDEATIAQAKKAAAKAKTKQSARSTPQRKKRSG